MKSRPRPHRRRTCRSPRDQSRGGPRSRIPNLDQGLGSRIPGPNLTCFRVRIACSFYPKWVNSRCRLPDLQHGSMGNCQPADIPISRLNRDTLSASHRQKRARWGSKGSLSARYVPCLTSQSERPLSGVVDGCQKRRRELVLPNNPFHRDSNLSGGGGTPRSGYLGRGYPSGF